MNNPTILLNLNYRWSILFYLSSSPQQSSHEIFDHLEFVIIFSFFIPAIFSQNLWSFRICHYPWQLDPCIVICSLLSRRCVCVVSAIEAIIDMTAWWGNSHMLGASQDARHVCASMCYFTLQWNTLWISITGGFKVEICQANKFICWLLTHCGYCSLVLSHRFVLGQIWSGTCG